MRNQILVAAVSVLAAFSASAQQAEERPSMEPVGSPFTYEVLGATPSVRLHLQRPRAAAPAVAAETNSTAKAASKAPAEAQANAAAVVNDRTRTARTVKQ